MDQRLPHVAIPGDELTSEVFYYFVIDTDRSVGEYEGDELAAAVSGCFVEGEVTTEARSLAEQFRFTYPEAFAWIREALLELPDDEFGNQCVLQKIETPGGLNDGRGHLSRENEAPPTSTMYLERPWYAYQSMRLTFDRPLTEEEVQFLTQRAREYAAATHSFALEGVRLLRSQTLVTCMWAAPSEDVG